MKEKKRVIEKVLITLFIASISCVCITMLLSLFIMGVYMIGIFEINSELVDQMMGVGMIATCFTLLFGFLLGGYVEFIKGRG